MKKLISLVLSAMIVISILAGLDFTVNAEETTPETTFPYSNAGTYVADSIIKGVIDRAGEAHEPSGISLALLHNYTYHKIAEELVDDELLVFNSLFWQNLKSTLDGDFLNIVNWQEEMYILLIIDYLNYYSESDEFKSNYAKNTIKFTENIYKTVIKYADSEYLDNVDEIIKNQSLSDAVAFSNKWGIVDDLKKYNSILGDIETVSTTAIDYYKNLTKALSVQKADEARIEFLKQMKKAGSDNYYFVSAVDNVISMYESSYGSLAFSQGAQTMLKHGMSVLFSEAKKACPEAAAIIDGLKIYNEGLNWLFNSDDISNNNLKLIIVYTIGSYAGTALRNLRDTYQSNPTEYNANAFINGYLGYLKYQEYASNNTIGFVSSALFDGVVNQIINCFSDKNSLTYDEFEEYFHNDISFCQSLEKLVQKYYDLYYGFIGYDATTITDDDPQDNLTEIDPNTATNDNSDFSQVLYQLLVSGQTVIKENFTLNSNLEIYGDLYLDGGTLDLNGYKLSVGGKLIQSDGEMYINGGKLFVTGDYRIQKQTSNGNYSASSGWLIMDKKNDEVHIDGNFITESEKGTKSERYDYSDENVLIDGTMYISGDFKQLMDGIGNFRCTGNHSVVLNGESAQEILFEDTGSRFNILKAENNNIKWKGSLSIEKVVSAINITAEQLIIYNLNLNEKQMFINGNVLMDGSVDLGGGSLSVKGNLVQSDGEMYINGGKLFVTGDYRIQQQTSNGNYSASSGWLIMDKKNDEVHIDGNFITESEKGTKSERYDYSDENVLIDGTMYISGDFKQLMDGIGNFRCTGNHTVVLNGESVQEVLFESTASWFNILKLTKDKDTGYKFSPDKCWNYLYLNNGELFKENETETTEPPTYEPTEAQPTSEPTTEPPTYEPTEVQPTSELTTEPLTYEPTEAQVTSEPTTEPPTYEPTEVQPTSEPTTEPFTYEPTEIQVTSEPTTEPLTYEPTEAQSIVEPTTEPLTYESTESQTTVVSTTELPTYEPTEAQSTIEPTTVPPTTDSTEAQPTTEPTTEPLTTESTEAQQTSEPTTVPLTTKSTEAQPTVEPTTVPPTTDSTEVQPTTEPTTESPTIESTEAQPTVAPTTEPPTYAPTEEQSSSETTKTPDTTATQAVTQSTTATIYKPTVKPASKPKPNTLKVSVNKSTVKAKKLKKKAQKIKPLTVKNAVGKVSFKIKKAPKKLKKLVKINNKGVITIKKWKKAKKGNYKIKVTITAAGNKDYLPLILTKTVKVKIK